MKKAFSLAVALLAALAAAAQENPAAQQSLEQLARKEPLRGAVLGAVVRGADGRIVAAYNPTLRLVPASNLKLVTTCNETILWLNGNYLRLSVHLYNW